MNQPTEDPLLDSQELDKIAQEMRDSALVYIKENLI